MDVKNQHEPSVLIIEDDPGHQKLLEILVKRSGCRCDCAFDGRSGVSKAESNRYDLIFVDIHIPEMDGFMVISQLKDRGIETPLIAITALHLEGLERAASAAGFSDFLRKPIEQATVNRLIDTYVHAKQG
ncbi:MAG: response regulator [Sedimentisphaerales bacterium]|nr:response regulator [Sedimentisphaerales bacterium]